MYPQEIMPLWLQPLGNYEQNNVAVPMQLKYTVQYCMKR